MSGPEYRVLKGRIREIEVFFNSDWGFLLSHGLSRVILGRLQEEFANGIKTMHRDRNRLIADRIRADAQRKIEQAWSEIGCDFDFETDDLPPEEDDEDADPDEPV